jgi:hypothetical protein
VDILPTLMGLLGSDYIHASWGRNILELAGDDQGFAVLNVLNRVAYMERDFYYREQIGHLSQLFDRSEMPNAIRNIANETPEAYNRLRRRLHLYLQAADEMSTPGAK